MKDTLTLKTMYKTTLSLLLLVFSQISHADNLVSVSNYPLFLLSESVTQDTPTKVKQLLQPGDVGHHGSLSPSDIKTIKDSKYIIWFGDELERNLTKTLKDTPNAISLFNMNAFNRKPLRDIKTKPIQGTLDPHIWLDPNNAKAIVRALAQIHSNANPQYSKTYQANAKKFAQRMDKAVADIQKKAPKQNSYWAYHDAYQYMEPALKIRLAGTLTPDHHLPPKASQFKWLNDNRPAKQMCMLTQGEATQGMIKKLAPLSTITLQEDMSETKDFIDGWKTMVESTYNCINIKK